jgi:ABC-type lipoprotein export system ATPase subunit
MTTDPLPEPLPEPSDETDNEPDTLAGQVVLEGKALQRRFGASDEVFAVRDIDISVRAGELLALVGRSGSGKSTLLHLLAGLDRPSSGHVLHDGEDIAELSDGQRAQRRARRLAFVLQRDNLIPALTIRENVAAPLILGGTRRSASLRRADEMLDRVGLSHRAGARPAEVSGGEAQRAAVARACAGRPVVIFADEPTGALDSANSEMVVHELVRAARDHGAALVMVTHDETAARSLDRVLHLADGAIVESEVVGRAR